MNYITTISVLVSAICVLLSISITLAIFWLNPDPTKIHYPEVLLSLAASLAASGIVSFLFLVVRSYEQHEVERREISIDNIHKELLSGRIYTDLPDLHCVFGNHPTEHVATAIHAVPLKEKLVVDALGLNLNQFMEEQIKPELQSQRSVDVRLITHHPDSEHLEVLCRREGRNKQKIEESIKETAKWVNNYISDTKESGLNTDSVELKWSRDFSTITMVRINDRMFVRPRLLNEASTDLMYEIYDKKINPKAFEIYSGYFTQTWETADKPNLPDTETISA